MDNELIIAVSDGQAFAETQSLLKVIRSILKSSPGIDPVAIMFLAKLVTEATVLALDEDRKKHPPKKWKTYEA